MPDQTPDPWTVACAPFDDGTPFHRIKAGDGHGHRKAGVVAPADAALLAAAPPLLAVLAVLALGVAVRTAQTKVFSSNSLATTSSGADSVAARLIASLADGAR